MLRGLSIRDILLIQSLDLEFSRGLNVLTGETGAGKSILLESLGFVLGIRGRSEPVPFRSETGEVSASFTLSAEHPARNVLSQFGFPVSAELLLRRTVSSSGRKAAFVNDRRCTRQVLQAFADTLLEIHGQQADQGLMNQSQHRALLDACADHGELLQKTRTAWRSARTARRELEDAEANLARSHREVDFLKHSLRELEALAPEPGEDAELDTRRKLMKTAERIRNDVVRADEAIGPNGAEGMAVDAMRWLEGARSEAEGRIDEIISSLERVLVEVGEAQQLLHEFRSSLEFEPYALERTEERLFSIRAAARKHGVHPDELARARDEMHRRLSLIEESESRVCNLGKEVRSADKAYEALAAKLTIGRQEAAEALDAGVTRELAPLKLENAMFQTCVAEGTRGPEGVNRVEFLIATNPGTAPGPIAKIASGGELSRFMLALKVCLASGAFGMSLIFDEIDRGIGGATADAVGRRLQLLAKNSQVLVVTHSPQVAAFGQRHLRVEKRTQMGFSQITVTQLDDKSRIEEIARMLSGDKVTGEARAAALALLGGASKNPQQCEPNWA